MSEPPLDISARMKLHLEFYENAGKCAKRGSEHLKRGEVKEAADALAEADAWIARAALLELRPQERPDP